MKKLSVFLLIMALGMAGCGESPTQMEATLRPTTTPPLPTTTPTALPTLTPTEQPTQTPSLLIQPEAGKTFSGPIQIGWDKASSGTLSFIVSDDGAMITNFSVGFKDFKCESMSASEFSTSSSGEFLLSNEWEFSLSNIGQIEGRFTSPTTASGTITLNIKIKIMNSTISCDMGIWEWSAEAQ